MIQDIKDIIDTKYSFKIFVREDDILNYPDQNMKHIDEKKSVYKGVYGELMNICTQKDILFEHLIKEDNVYLIKDCYFSKLVTKNQRSVWNNVKYYPNRCEEKPIFSDKLVQRRLNLFSNDVLNYYGLEKNDSTFKKRIIIVDRNTEYRSFKHTIVNPKNPNEKATSLLDILNDILLKSTWMNYYNIVYLEDLKMLLMRFKPKQEDTIEISCVS